MTKTLLIAGGAGFIGSNFCHLLQAYGCRGVVVDALTYAGSEQNLADIPPDVLRFVKADIRDSASIEEVLRSGFHGDRFDAVINFAAESHVDRSISDAMPFVSTNVSGAVTLLEAARLHGIPTFVQVSTDEVYGSIDGGAKFRTDSPLNPSSAYSASKASADLLLRSFYKTHRYDVRITRCTNNYGPYQHREKLIPTIIQNAIESKHIPIYGDGKQVRDWIYVDDHCHGLFAVLRAGEPGGVYHFGGPESDEVTNLDLASEILMKLGARRGKDPQQMKSLLEHVIDRPGHDRRYALDWSASAEALGWAPATRLSDGIKKTLDWYLDAYRASN